VDKKQFREIMKVLGLFATEKQASALFERYDINGDGKLTVFEFIKRCRTNDYQKLDVDDVTTNLVSQTKKEYTTSRPQRMDSMPWSIDDLCLKLREKCEQNYPVGQTASFPRLRRELARAFEFTDFTFLRYVPREGLVRTLDFINFSMHANYISMLMSAFPAQPLKGETVPLFSYPAFVLALFPTAVKAPAMSLTFRPADEQKSQKEYEDANRNQSTGFLKGGSRALTARPPSHAAPKERPRSRLQIVGSRHVRPQYQKAWFKPREALAPPAGTCLAAEALQWVDDTPQMATRGIKSVPRRPMTSRLP
jgi:Ca2+-binding EF-hand superfamily protein